MVGGLIAKPTLSAFHRLPLPLSLPDPIWVSACLPRGQTDCCAHLGVRGTGQSEPPLCVGGVLPPSPFFTLISIREM